jgi:hypothetical protein
MSDLHASYNYQWPCSGHDRLFKKRAHAVALVAYLAFVPSGDAVAGVHPERVIAGAFCDRGLVVTRSGYGRPPVGADWEADLGVGQATIICRLPGKPPA